MEMGSNFTIGFVLLTHAKPNQILRLIDRLNFMFEDPPIVCHHDFLQCNLPLDAIPENVSFVRPHLKTVWGEWSLVEATLQAIKLLYSQNNPPEWFTLLSGSDYPIKSSRKILSDFKKSSFDAHISSKKLVKNELKNEEDKALYLRYQTLIFKYPSIIHLVQMIRKQEWATDDIRVKNSKLIRHFSPFSQDFNCYMGSQWFSANRKAAEYILKFDATHTKIRNYYRKVHCPDESYFHSILNNADDLKISSKNWRYVDWTGRIANPRELGSKDLPELRASNDHFARKFNIDKNSELLDWFDDVIGYQ